MSKPSAEKAQRQQRKQHQKRKRHNHRSAELKRPSYIESSFPGERLGAPTGGVRWLGEMIASLVRPRPRHRF